MPGEKKTRQQLKAKFADNSIPTGADFAALIDAGLNQTDDAVGVSAGVLSVDSIASKTANTVLALSGNGNGGVQVNDPLTVTGALNANMGLTVTGAGATIGTVAGPTVAANQQLTVYGAVTATGLVTASNGLTVTGTTGLTVDAISSKTTNTVLAVSGDGCG